ncbi:MAG TPA: cytochrome c oxidase subunit 3 [Chloroflexota bacterium]|jgi:cytochrome c oxidase subunit 3
MSASASAFAGGSTAHAEIVPQEQEGPSNEWLGMVLFIVSEAVMFGAFFAQYFYARILSDVWPNPTGLPPGFERVPAFPLPLIMTVLLVASGFTAHWAQNAIHRDDRGGVEGWLIITLLLGLSFLGAQAFEYANFIFVDGFNISSGIYGTIFFSLTGLHGFHVIVGTVLLVGVLVRTFLGHFSARNCFGLEGTILYWHFVDAVWIALYLTLYLL